MLNVGQELLNVPFADMLASIGLAIAQSQTALDNESMDILTRMADQENYPVYLPKVENGQISQTPTVVSMLAAGFQPTFYQFSETMIEVKMDISVSGQATEAVWNRNSRSVVKLNNRAYLLRATPINATYTNRYNYSIEGASILKTRLVPIPPNAIMQDIIESTYDKLDKAEI